jgi:hypothetical protein
MLWQIYLGIYGGGSSVSLSPVRIINLEASRTTTLNLEASRNTTLQLEAERLTTFNLEAGA